MKKAVFAGSFDPFTLGHEKILEEVVPIFDKVYVALCINPDKTYLLSVEKRLEIIQKVCSKYTNVVCVYHDGLLVDLMKKEGIEYNIRGIRDEKDLEYENNLKEIYKSQYPEMVSIYIPCENKYKDISSTKVRELLKQGKDLSGYLPYEAIEVLQNDII